MKVHRAVVDAPRHEKTLCGVKNFAPRTFYGDVTCLTCLRIIEGRKAKENPAPAWAARGLQAAFGGGHANNS